MKPLNAGNDKTKSTLIGLCTSEIWCHKKFSIYFLWSIIFVLTNYLQLLLYISYEQSDLYMLVTIKAFLVTITYTRQK